jgi:hypothetical protein
MIGMGENPKRVSENLTTKAPRHKATKFFGSLGIAGVVAPAVALLAGGSAIA